MPNNNYLSMGALIAGCVVTAIHADAARAAQPFLLPNSLIISSTTYDNSQGVIASLAVGAPICGWAPGRASPPALAGGSGFAAGAMITGVGPSGMAKWGL